MNKMKKIFLLAIITLLFTSCTNTTYNVSFVDMKNPSDTLCAKVSMLERFSFAGEETHFDVICDNTGTINYPVFTYTLKSSTGINVEHIYASQYPIVVTRFEVIEIKE